MPAFVFPSGLVRVEAAAPTFLGLLRGLRLVRPCVLSRDICRAFLQIALSCASMLLYRYRRVIIVSAILSSILVVQCILYLPYWPLGSSFRVLPSQLATLRTLNYIRAVFLVSAAF